VPGSNATEVLPLFPLGTVLVPGMQVSLHVFEPRYRQLVSDLLGGAKAHAPEFGVVALRRGWEVGELDDLHEIGTTALITDVLPLSDGRCNIAAIGRRRFAIRSVDKRSQPYLQAEVQFLPEPEGQLRAGAAAALRAAARRHTELLSSLGVEVDEPADLDVDAQGLGYAIARQPALSLADRQAILAAESTAERLSVAAAVLRRELELVRRLHAVPVSAADFRAGTAPPG
jgi:Lon protease-like protein